MGEGGPDRRKRLEQAALGLVFLLVVALFVYSMIDAWVLSISERPWANPLEQVS